MSVALDRDTLLVVGQTLAPFWSSVRAAFRSQGSFETPEPVLTTPKVNAAS